MKVIFLDIDGVLVTRESLKRGKLWTNPHPPCVRALNHLIKETNAKIVVSSSWRLSVLSGNQTQEDFFKMLSFWGIKGEFIGITPDLNNGRVRGHEIWDWLTNNKEVKDFVILDDDSDMDFLSDFLVKTDMEGGLTMEKAKEAIEILSPPDHATWAERTAREATSKFANGLVSWMEVADLLRRERARDAQIARSLIGNIHNDWHSDDVCEHIAKAIEEDE